MREVSFIFNKVIVREFYRANAGMFLLVIGLGVGFLRSYEHIALAEFFVGSPLLMLIPIFVWTIYTLNVLKFNRDILTRKENEFIFHVTLLPAQQKWRVIIASVYYQLLPAVLYGIFLMMFALKHQVVTTLLMPLGALVFLVLAASLAFSRSLHHPNQEKKVGALTRLLNVSITKPYPVFFPEWIARREPIMLLGTKAFACLMLLGATQLYKTDVYDLRLLGLGIVIAFSAQVSLVAEIHRFDNFHFSLNHNLPIRISKRLMYFFSTTLILLIPELGIILKNFPAGFTFVDWTSSIFLSLSISVLFYGLLYAKDRDQEKFMPFVFFVSICWILLVLFKIPLWAIATVNFIIGLTCMKKFYYSFEYISKTQ